MDDNSAERMFYHVRSREVDAWRRRTFVTILFSILVVASFVYFAPTLRSILLHKDKLLEAQLQGMQAIPDIQAKIASLNDQMKVLSTTSIENRLQTIETAMSVGNVKPEQIATVEDMRKEIDTLKSYMFSDPKALVDLKQLEKDYGELNTSLKNSPTKSELEGEISTTKDLIHLTWALFGIPIALLILFGPKIWGSGKPIPTAPVTKPAAVEQGGEK
jgi:hypothetical protein